MGRVRTFVNSPAFATKADAAAYLATMPVIAARGYRGPDGSLRLLVEVSLDCAADEVADEAGRIRREARKLDATADETRKRYLTGARRHD